MEENKKKELKVNNLYRLRYICEIYGVKYQVNKGILNLKRLAPYVDLERVPNTKLYIVKEMKIKPEEVE